MTDHQDNELWTQLFRLAPVRRAKPASTLYDIIVDGADLDTAKRFIEGGHSPSQSYAGGHAVSLAIAHGNLDFVRCFVESNNDLSSAPDLLERAVKRLSEANDESLETARQVFEYVLSLELEDHQLAAGFTNCAMWEQYSAALAMLEAGMTDIAVRVGPNETIPLSKQLARLGKADYAALLTGSDVDHKVLQERELSERESNAALKAMFEDIEEDGFSPLLSDSAWEKAYQKLISRVRSGELQGHLWESDAHFSRTPLEFAAANGMTDLVVSLLESDAQPSDPSQARFDAAVAAATWGHLDTLEALKAAGVPVEATPPGNNSPLSEACRYGHAEVVSYLLSKGADRRSGDGAGHDFTLEDITGGDRRNEILEMLRVG